MGSSIKGSIVVFVVVAALSLPGETRGQSSPGEQGPAAASNASPPVFLLPSRDATGLPEKPEPVVAEAAVAPPAAFRVPAQQKTEAVSGKRNWLMLAISEHGAAAFDAYTTRQAISEGHRELDPLMRPFAHSDAMYAAMQAEPVLFDLLGRRMMRSRIGWMRRTWWLPQTLATAGFVWSGIHNTNLPRIGKH
jgi:hypothetical protein